MTTQTSTQTRKLTAAEVTKLRRLYHLHEEAKTFNQAVKRHAQMDAYMGKLMDSGVSARSINTTLARGRRLLVAPI